MSIPGIQRPTGFINTKVTDDDIGNYGILYAFFQLKYALSKKDSINSRIDEVENLNSEIENIQIYLGTFQVYLNKMESETEGSVVLSNEEKNFLQSCGINPADYEASGHRIFRPKMIQLITDLSKVMTDKNADIQENIVLIKDDLGQYNAFIQGSC